MCGRFWRRGVPVVDPVISAVYNVTLGATGNVLFASGTVCASANVCKSAMGRRSSLGLPNLKVDDLANFAALRPAAAGEIVEVYVQGPTHVAKYEARKT